ncbi:MAG: RluA family pseudouridine synthase [Gemmatimonadetes bacterium]|nr:RluA family pseudouridine synthase [Gemmatimonadota bacterium]
MGPDAPQRGPERRVLVVEEDGNGARLDRWLAAHLDLSRTRIASLVESGNVLLNGAPPRKSESVKKGDHLEVEVPEPEPLGAEAENLPLDIVYQDRHLVVVNKAAGMVVHPAAGHPRGTLVNALLHHVRDLSGIGGVLRPGIVHRLDRDTSGLMVVAKDDGTHRELSVALKERRVRRLYMAASWGHFRESPLRVDAPIGRDPRDRRRMAVNEDGRRAVTRVRARERWPAAELLDVALETGRTHQIRVHLAHLGHPIVGDPLYGVGRERGMGGPDRGWARELAKRTPRTFLHAAHLAFVHPATGAEMRFDAPLPSDLEAVVEWVRGLEREREETGE